jgi:hypothetical protein
MERVFSRIIDRTRARMEVQAITGDGGCTARQRACDIRKLRAKNLITRQDRLRRCTPPDAARTIAAIVVVRDQVLIPCPAGVRASALAPSPVNPATADQHSRNSAARCECYCTTAASRPDNRNNLSIMFCSV